MASYYSIEGVVHNLSFCQVGVQKGPPPDMNTVLFPRLLSRYQYISLQVEVEVTSY